MQITLELPPHVAAGFTDEAEASAWLLVAATEHAKAQAMAVASDEAQALLRAAAAPFDGADAPVTLTVGQRIEQVAANAVILGTRLAVEAAHADPSEVHRVVSEVLGGSPG